MSGLLLCLGAWAAAAVMGNFVGAALVVFMVGMAMMAVSFAAPVSKESIK